MYHYYNMNYGRSSFVTILYGHFYHYNDPYFTRPQWCQALLPPPIEMIPNVLGPLYLPFACPIFGVYYRVEIINNPPNPARCITYTRPSISSSQEIRNDEVLPASVPPCAPSTSEKIMNPHMQIQRKVFLVLNDINKDNFQAQMEIIKTMITDKYLKWFSKHLVSHFVNEKYDFYALTSDLLDSMNNKKFNEFMLCETYRFIKVLLNNMQKEENNKKMNNLGQLLGIMTLSRNQPILFEDLDIKSLLLNIEKDKTELDFILPFVSKILESCANSKIFQPKCSWTKLMIARLVEIQKNSSLSETSQHALDVLFQILKIDQNEIEPIFK